jgi:hypothetical protein
VRADADEAPCLSVDGLSPHDTELVSLLFAILGWRVLAVDSEPPDGLARLHMRPVGDIVCVTTPDPALAPRLAATGLDRLVRPLELHALEHLSVLAG